MPRRVGVLQGLGRLGDQLGDACGRTRGPVGPLRSVDRAATGAVGGVGRRAGVP